MLARAAKSPAGVRPPNAPVSNALVSNAPVSKAPPARTLSAKPYSAKPYSAKRSSAKSSPAKSSPAKSLPAKPLSKTSSRTKTRLSPKVLAHAGFVVGALGFFVFAVASTSHVPLATASVDTATVDEAAVAPAMSVALERRIASAPRRRIANAYDAILDPSRSLNGSLTKLSPRVALGSDVVFAPPVPQRRIQLASADPQADIAADIAADNADDAADAAPLPLPKPDLPLAVASVPMPTPRPARSHAADRGHPAITKDNSDVARENKDVALAKPEPDHRSIFEKLFGAPPSGLKLAYAPSDGGIFSSGQSVVPGRYDRYTAVYDISNHVVYLPDGTKLEAHSGLGSRMDDPRFVHERMRGATPPHMYDLKLREKLFHGVQAIRLTPVGGESSIYGRTGLLAHTYMLGPNGQSNGCVSFRNYDKFLHAFESGQIKRLAVVARL